MCRGGRLLVVLVVLVVVMVCGEQLLWCSGLSGSGLCACGVCVL